MSAVLAVDLGNSEAKFGLIDGGRLVGVARVPTRAVRSLDAGADLLLAAPGLEGLIAGNPPAALGSVVSWAGARLAALLTGLGCPVQPLTSLDPFGLQIDYEHGEPGVDRVAACAEAYRRTGGPLILVGAGTAIHTNVVTADGVYLGGAIMPGLRLMAESLSLGTDQIRRIDPAKPRRVIGHTTPECVEIGIYYGWLGGALRLIDETKTELGGNPHLWLTGGQSAWLKPHLKGAQADADLALYGLAMALERKTES